MKEFAAAEWQRARRTLASGSELWETDPDSAASRAYYAAFHAVTALFALRGQITDDNCGLPFSRPVGILKGEFSPVSRVKAHGIGIYRNHSSELLPRDALVAENHGVA